MSGGTERRWWLAAVLVAVAIIAAATVVLDLVTPPDPLGGSLLHESPGWVSAGTGVLLTVLGVLVWWRHPGHRLGWLLVGFGCFWVVDGLASSYVRYAVEPTAVRPGVNIALLVVDRLGAFLPLGLAALLLLYPTGRFVSGRWGVAGRVALAVETAACLALAVSPAAEVDGLPEGVDRNLGAMGLPDPFVGVLLGLAVASFVVPLATVLVRHRRTTGAARERVRWMVWAMVTDVLLVVLATLLFGAHLPTGVFFLVVAVPAVAAGVGLVHPRLVKVDDLLGGTLVYGLLAVVTVTVDLLAVALLTTLLGDALGQRQVVVVVLLLTAVLYGPLRQQLWRWVRRLLLGHRDDPYAVVAALASSLEQVDDGADQLATVASSVAATFGVRYVRVEVDRSRGERLIATHGTAPETTRAFPISYRGSDIGRLVLPARGVRANLSSRDQELLRDLVRQAAVAARSGQLAEDLQHGREQLVLAREEERRRIRRDLHDGLGPSLSGVVFQLESARLQVQSDPAAAIEQITSTRDQLQDVIADVRRLVHDLRPPALDDLGLVGALQQQAAAASTSGVHVSVHPHDVGTLPAAVEVAAYRIVGEAMTNVLRHASATRCDVSLTTRDGQLHVQITDDGTGIAPQASAGVGLLSLRERAAELGGHSEVVCPASGGTVVCAWLPVRSEP